MTDLQTEQCPTCDIPEGSWQVVWESRCVLVNHYLDDSDNYAGWIVASPKRHITRWFELTDEELQELGLVLRALDAAVTELFGSRRTMVASLGWRVGDHLHVHCVPTFGEEITNGYENFNGTWSGVPVGAREVVSRVAARLGELLAAR